MSEGIRTPGSVGAKGSNDNNLRKLADQDGAKSGALGAQKVDIDADLVAVIDAWPDLPDAVKAGIVAMVGAAKAAGR